MKKLAGVNVCFIYSPFESRAKCKCHRGSIIFPAFQLLFSLHSKRQPHFFCVTFFYLIRYYETAYSFINPLVVLYQPSMTVSDTRLHLLSSDVFLINAVFCRHNIAVTITDQRCRFSIAVSLTNTWVSITVQRKKIKMVKTDPN